MKPSGRILFLAVFLTICSCDTSHAIYDPRDTYPVKPAKHREHIIPWYLSNITSEPSIESQISGWDLSIDSTPRNPIIVNDGGRSYRPQYETANGIIEQQSITNFDNNYMQSINENLDSQQTHDFDPTYVNTNQHYEENGWFTDNDDSQKPYEEFAIESKKPYKEPKDFTTNSVESMKIAKYDSATGTQCPTSDATGQFVYLPDCKYFVNCWNGRAFVQVCAPGTLFNPETLECDFPSKVQCYNKKLEALTDSHNVPPPVKKRPFSTGSQTEWRAPAPDKTPSCPPSVTGLLQHPNDCTKYLQCANGGTFIMDCGPGTVFNPAISVCDWPYNVRGCEDALKPKTEKIIVPILEDIDVRVDSGVKTSQSSVQSNVAKCPDGHEGLFPHPSDCKKFLQCNNGNTYTMDCGPGTVFNPALTFCDFPYNVEGCDEETQSITENPQSGINSYQQNSGGENTYVQNGHHETTHSGYIPNVQNGQSFYNGEAYDQNYNQNLNHRGDHGSGQPPISLTPHPDLNENIYVDSNYKLPGEDEIPNEYRNHDRDLPATTPVFDYVQPPTTTESIINQQSWNQEETGIHRPGQFEPSPWRGQDNTDKRPSNSPVQRPWVQGSKKFGVNKNTGATSSMTIYNVLHQNSMINNKTKPDADIATDSNASNLLHGNRNPFVQYQNKSKVMHFSLTNGPVVEPNQGYGLEYWRATEGNMDVNESNANAYVTNKTESILLSAGNTIREANFNDRHITTHKDDSDMSKIDTTTKYYFPGNDPTDFSPGKIELVGHKATNLEIDAKLDQWAMKTNIFHQGHNKPGTKTARQGKEFSASTSAKDDKRNSTNPKNKNWYPNGIYVDVNGIKGHYIIKDVEINQGHSNTRQYGSNNGTNSLGKPNSRPLSTTFYENHVTPSGGSVIKQPHTQNINQELGTNIFGTMMSTNSRIINKTSDLPPTKTKVKLTPLTQNNLNENPEHIHETNRRIDKPSVGCNQHENGSENCIFINNLTEGGRDYHTTDRNTPYVIIEFDNDKDKHETPNKTSPDNATPESSASVEDASLAGDVNDDTDIRKPILIFENKTTEDSKTSTIMKINGEKTDLEIFGVELIHGKEEPPFPVDYMPPVQPVNYHSPLEIEISPISGQVLRLRGGSSLEEGYLEVQGAQPGWGIVCDRRNEWTLEEANVVCRQLGYTRGAEMAWQGQNNQDDMLRWIAADSVHCLGNETYFQSCKFTHDSGCDITRDAVGIRCLPNRVAYCREDEIPHRGFCYHLANPDSALNHAEALGYCNNKGSRLLDIADQNENNFISELLVQKYPHITSVMTSGFGFTTWNRTLWLWEDSHHAKFRFAKWWPGWMSDITKPPSVGIRPSCIVMKRNFPCYYRPDESCTGDYFFWDTEDCAASSKGHSYICKRAYNDIGCVYGKGQHYSGKANVTASGSKCLSWGDESVQIYLNFKAISLETREKFKQHNYCRNPNPNREIKPWCFTGLNGQYDHCDIPPCAKRGIKKSVAAGHCKPKHFECTPGECIPSPWICDGEEDCTNGADEQACFQHLESYTKIENYHLDGYDVEKWLNTPLKTCALRCKEADFTCRSFSHKTDDNICLLSASNIGLTGALQPSDTYDYYEMNERSIDCSDMFVCGNRKCINQSLVCDGKNSCGDRTDESICDLETLGYEIRLSGSNNSEEGKLEVKAWGHWGQVCDDGFTMNAANVACKELGFTFGAREVRAAGFYGEGESTLFLMDQVKCRGNETSLRECDFDGWGVHNCLPEEAVGIVCKTAVNTCPDGSWKCDNSPECIPIPFICDVVKDCDDNSDEGPEHCEAPFELRLANGSNEREGRVEVRHHGIWGTVCDDDFSTATATVICRSLGYLGSATALKDGFFGPGEGPIWLDEVSCSGNESYLYRCDHEYWGRHNCGHEEDAGVRCEPGEVPEQFDPAVPDLSEIQINDLLPADCGMRVEDFDETDEYMARVVQGSVAPKGAYPWQASLRLRGHSKSTHWCGAVVISPRHVLTAAHCLEGYNKGMYFVRAGDHNTEVNDGTEVEVNIQDYYIHEDFRKGQLMNNDIALVLLKGRGIPLGRNIMPICLPPENIEYLPGLNCTISGWGSIESGRTVHSHFLRFGWVPLLDQSVCQAEYVYGEGAISNGMVCAGYLNEGVDSCHGDSGGPLACYHNNAFTLYGITSWGKHCGEPNKPGVYVRIAHYRRWIDQKIQESSTGR